MQITQWYLHWLQKNLTFGHNGKGTWHFTFCCPESFVIMHNMQSNFSCNIFFSIIDSGQNDHEITVKEALHNNLRGQLSTNNCLHKGPHLYFLLIRQLCLPMHEEQFKGLVRILSGNICLCLHMLKSKNVKYYILYIVVSFYSYFLFLTFILVFILISYFIL